MEVASAWAKDVANSKIFANQEINQVVILIVTEDGAVQTFIKDKKDSSEIVL